VCELTLLFGDWIISQELWPHTRQIFFCVATVKTMLTTASCAVWMSWKHIQYCCQHFICDATCSVYQHVSSCMIMNASCWYMLSIFFIMRRIVYALLWTKSCFKRNYTVHTSYTKMTVGL
jgi:hypothetical protein